MNVNDFIWAEKYRPRKIDDCVLPDALKATFKGFIKKGTMPNLILCGSAGLGKTSVAVALAEEMEYEYLIINGSLDRNIDVLRNEISTFASAVSFEGKRKCVILDEADYLNPISTQPALRNFMEKFSNNCSFILTCNYKNKIIEPLHSRCSVIDFQFPMRDKDLQLKLLTRLTQILKMEKIEYDTQVLVKFVIRYFPNFRRTINELQKYASFNKKIDVGILANVVDEKIKSLIENMKNKRFEDIRKWVAENSDIDFTEFCRTLYDESNKYFEDASVPQLILHLANYSYKKSFVADIELNTMAMLTEIMMDCNFK